jgi:hypothetical protein
MILQVSFINSSLKAILARFLFSCFTGLRISDITRISPENIVGDTLIFLQKNGQNSKNTIK